MKTNPVRELFLNLKKTRWANLNKTIRAFVLTLVTIIVLIGFLFGVSYGIQALLDLKG